RQVASPDAAIGCRRHRRYDGELSGAAATAPDATEVATIAAGDHVQPRGSLMVQQPEPVTVDRDRADFPDSVVGNQRLTREIRDIEAGVIGVGDRGACHCGKVLLALPFLWRVAGGAGRECEGQ